MGTHLDKYLLEHKNDSFPQKPSNMISLSNTEVQNIEKMVKESADPDTNKTRLNCPFDSSSLILKVNYNFKYIN